ncbi:MAG: hypothetical protein H6523_13120 [Mycolicibacterium sp.]|nr:hypothetical protein [Mycolicibacterium sp.]
MSDPRRSVVDEHLREYPITAVELGQIERARRGDYAGLWRRTEEGRWEQL